MIGPVLCFLFALAVVSLLQSILGALDELATYTTAVCEGEADFPPRRTVATSADVPF